MTNNPVEGKWKNAGGGTQFFLLIVFWYFGVVLAASLTQLILGDASQSTAANIRFSNAIGSVFLFLVPFILYSYLFADTKGEFLNTRKINILTLLLGVLALFAIQPFIGLVNSYNELITLPESMAALNEAFAQAKEASEKALKLLFEEKTPANFLLNLLVLAVLPGILEELFFRGCMQRSLFRMSNNIHLAIWITAIIFSLLHFQLSGFFPRIIMGALLGYLYVWSKNIWIPVGIHFLHNATIVTLEQFFSDTELYKLINDAEGILIPGIISLVITVIILFTTYRKATKFDKDINESPSC